MKGFIAFTKKELIENVRNYRLLIILSLFVFFGLSGPILAKLMPTIIQSLSLNIEIQIPEPTALDAWVQFYKNISQIGFSMVIILFSSCLSKEYTSGTLTIMLTKGLSRNAVLLAKFSAAALITTLCYWVCFFISFGYTAFLWPDTTLPHVFFAAFSLWLIGILYLSILMLGCVLFRQAFTSLLFLFAIITSMSLLGLLPQASKINPFVLTSQNMALLEGSASVSQFIIPILISIILTILLLFCAMPIFNKKQI